MNITIIGAGINGLVAANYLQKAGHSVTILEKKPTCGGACCSVEVNFNGNLYEYPPGASVFGMMPDFIFKETGLADRVTFHIPEKPDTVKFLGHPPYSVEDYRKWGEKGDVAAFLTDLEAVASKLRQLLKIGKVPFDLNDSLWVRGSAEDLFKHYFTSELTKLLYSIPVNESGPVKLNEPYSAFNIVLMNSGQRWGFLKEGIWSITRNLAEINRELGVTIICDADVEKYDAVADGELVIFATDPVTAARLAGIDIGTKRYLGDSAKQIFFFDKPVDLDAFYFIFGKEKYIEIYPEGPIRRKLGWTGNEYICTYYKEGIELDVKEEVEALVGESVGNVLLTSKDIKEQFYFPEGNIDHMEICEGQTLWSRTFSKTDKFYQFGDNERYFYCGAGGFPCGSVAGTVGYLCAKEIIDSLNNIVK